MKTFLKNFWPWKRITELETQIEVANARLEKCALDLEYEQKSHGETKAQAQQHLDTSRRLAFAMHMSKIAALFLFLSCFGAFGQAVVRNGWDTNYFPQSLPWTWTGLQTFNGGAIIKSNLMIFSTPTNYEYLSFNGTNVVITCVQTNDYGSPFTNVFDASTLDTRLSRTLFGIGAGRYMLTNNLNASGDPTYHTDESTFIGYYAGSSMPGTNNSFNTAIGSFALASLTFGAGNIAIGQKALISATNDSECIAIGAKSLASCKFPNLDTAIGYGAMQFALGGQTNGDTSQGFRTAIGASAGNYDHGKANTWIGYGSGPQQAASPFGTIGIGNGTYQALTTANASGTAIGYQAGFNMNSANIGTLIGYQAGFNSTAMLGVGIGYQVGYGLGVINRCTFIGDSTASAWSGTALGDILIGYAAGSGAGQQQNNIAIIAADDPNAFISDVFFNNRISGSASTYPINLNAVGGFGANVAGAKMTVAGGIGTGTASGGDVNLAVALPGAAGSTANALTNIVNVSGTDGSINIRGTKLIIGAGSPNGVASAPVGSQYWRTDGGAATSLYVKESGTGNTGWVGK